MWFLVFQVRSNCMDITILAIISYILLNRTYQKCQLQMHNSRPLKRRKVRELKSFIKLAVQRGVNMQFNLKLVEASVKTQRELSNHITRPESSFYIPSIPPSTTTLDPVTKLLAGLAKNRSAPRRSLGSPHRPAGVLSSMKSLYSWC